MTPCPSERSALRPSFRHELQAGFRADDEPLCGALSQRLGVGLRSFLAVLLAVGAFLRVDVCADVNWDGDAGTGDFTDPLNWFGNAVPTFAFSSGNLVFNLRNSPSQLNQYYNFASWSDINDIIWETTWPVDTTFNGNGNGLNFNQRLENRSSKKVTIGTMNLSGGKNGASQIELNPVNGDLQLNGNVYNDNNLRYKVYGNNSKMLTVNTALTGNANVGLDIEAYSLVKITQAQTMGSSAAYNIKQGELWISGSGSLANGSTINLGEANGNTAKLYLEGANDGHAITVANSGGTKVIGSLDTSGTRTYSGDITLNGAVNLEAVQAGGTVDFTGALSGGSGVTVSGAGTVKLSGNNSYSGGTTVSSGTLLLGDNERLANAGAFTINGGTANLGGFSETVGAVSINGGAVTNGTLTGTSYTAQAGDVSAVLAGTGVTLAKNGTGVLYLSGANTYSGATSVNNGILEIRSAGGLGGANSGTTVSAGAALNVFQGSGGITVANEALALSGAGFNNADGALRNTGGNNAWNGAISLGAGARINADTTGSSGSLTIGGNITGGNNVLFLGAMGGTSGNTGGNITINGIISGDGSTQDGTITSIYKDGAGALTLGGANSYTGDTRIAVGNLTVASGGTLGNGTSDVYIAGGGSLAVNTNVTIASVREWANNDSGTISIGSGATLTVNGADKGTMYQNSISGAGGLTMAGSGDSILSLFGTQGYTGATTVSGGKLSTGVALASSGVTVSGGTFETSAADILGDTASVTVNSGTYKLGADDTIGALSGTGGAIDLGGNRLTTTIASGTSSYSNGAISGAGGRLTKQGNGTLSLGGTHSYTGTTTVSAGELRLVGATLSTSSSVSVSAGAKLGGYGSMGALGGAGSIDPGNSPGILTTTQVDPSGGLDFNFEFTGLAPVFDNPSASVNDLVRITGATPFSQSLNGANIIKVYFSGDALYTGGPAKQIRGGFFIGQQENFFSSISGATYDYYFAMAGGGTTYNGTAYGTKSEYESSKGFSITITTNTFAQSASFDGNTTINGQIVQFDVVPEPSTYALLALSAAGFGGYAIRRRRR